MQPRAVDPVVVLNAPPVSTRSNLVVAKAGTDGVVRIYNNAGNTDVVVDVLGWYSCTAPGSPALALRQLEASDDGVEVGDRPPG